MFIFLDTETTGIGPEDRLCQIAYKAGDSSPVCELFNPGMPISIDAMAIHHITNKMVQEKPRFKDSEIYTKLKEILSDDANVMVAHNANFDVVMLNKEGLHPRNVICTIKLARHLDRNGVIPKYNLQYLRYYLGLEIEAQAHDALGDIRVLEAVFNRICTKFQKNHGMEDPITEMIHVSSNPVLLPRMLFGKHKGLPFKEVSRDYLEWLLSTDLDEDMEYTVKTHLRMIPRG